MLRARATAIIHAARLDLRIGQVRRRERDALARAGEALATSAPRLPGGACQALLIEIQRLRRQLDAHGSAVASSRAADQADYAGVATWMRPMVVARGLSARPVLRHQARRCGRELGPLHERLASAALAEPSGASGGLLLRPSLADAVRAARTELASLVAERTRLLAPFDGQAYPAWAGTIAHEVTTFGRALVTQLQSQLVPRASALAGLAAGWWVTHTYTASRPRSFLRSLGIGSGGTHVVSSDTYRSLRFWLPILAAAIAAYLGDRLARWIQRRYHPRPEPITELSPTT